jgi:hypothetical protein
VVVWILLDKAESERKTYDSLSYVFQKRKAETIWVFREMRAAARASSFFGTDYFPR